MQPVTPHSFLELYGCKAKVAFIFEPLTQSSNPNRLSRLRTISAFWLKYGLLTYKPKRKTVLFRYRIGFTLLHAFSSLAYWLSPRGGDWNKHLRKPEHFRRRRKRCLREEGIETIRTCTRWLSCVLPRWSSSTVLLRWVTRLLSSSCVRVRHRPRSRRTWRKTCSPLDGVVDDEAEDADVDHYQKGDETVQWGETVHGTSRRFIVERYRLRPP